MKILILLPCLLFGEMSGYIFNQHPPLSSPTSGHILTKSLDESIEFDDGSTWKVSLYDARKASYWPLGGPVTLTQNTRWFSNYHYRLIHSDTGSYIEINLHQAPPISGEKTRSISELEPARNSLILSDHTHWKISPDDIATLQTWNIQDLILIGDNSENNEWENILINTKKSDEYIRAQQFF